MAVQILLAKGKSGQASNLGHIQDDAPDLKGQRLQSACTLFKLELELLE
jgi:hypothetical protein